jgi:sugar/nucleoside kinase (ribokinase family)
MLLRVDARGRVVVAGHICLDLIPAPGERSGGGASEALGSIGPLELAPGGCVGNTGVALSRLGLATTLVARVGDDPLGRLLGALVRDAAPGADLRLLTAARLPTSYSLVSSRPGRDRTIRHFVGANEAFTAADVSDDLLRGARLLHVGYPPLLAGLVEADGRGLADLLGRARRLGLVTSIDMANANLGGDDRSRWRRVLGRILPTTDIFLPSLGEATRLLARRVRRGARGSPDLAAVARLADAFIELGAGIAGIKLGDHGLYVRTAPGARLASVVPGLGPGWDERELYSSVFETDAVGTTGAGDATAAGFLLGVLAGLAPGDALTAACAVGGSSTEAVDGTSAVRAWPEIEARIRGGWRRRPAQPGPGWRALDRPGLWCGPRDAGSAGGRG